VKNQSNRLDYEQVRRFICDGVLVLDSGVERSVHDKIYDKIQWNNTREFNMGNNVLPRVAELQQIIDAPAIQGALNSILGDDYILHPHRFMHASEPLPESERNLNLEGHEHAPPMGEGSVAQSNWHQDGHCPLSRARYHLPRFAMIMYFPQDTPVERGPTRVIPGTQLQPYLEEEDYPFAFVCDHIKAGTCFLIAWDIAHAALSNLTGSSRYMLKFIFMRTRNPEGPSWDGDDGPWQQPQERLGRYDHNKAWSYIWDWMRSAPRSENVEATSNDIERWTSLLNNVDQEARLDAIYRLAEAGAEAVTPVIESLLQYADLGLECDLPRQRDEYGSLVAEGDPNERHWSDRAYALQDEAYALGAMGEVAIEALIELLKHDDPWIKINVAFSLGEIGPNAARAIPALTELLDHKMSQVVRVSLDAMACIGSNTSVALPAICKVLTLSNPDWQEPSARGGWLGETQVRFNALYALLCSDIPMDEIDDLLVACLNDRFGYVHSLALEALTRERNGENRPGLRKAVHYLKTHRWDHTLANGQRVF
jgi:HEAT repeat protein